MSVASNREEFVQRMTTALEEEASNPPTQDQVRRYFRTLRGRTQDALEAYEGYAALFFVHVGDSRNPGSNVVYPGGAGGRNTCDSLTEVLARRSEGGRHVIDCRGFCVMGIELLQEAGFRFVRYMIAIPPRATGDEWQGHVIAELSHSGRQSVFLGNNRIYPSAAGAVERVAGWDIDDSANVRFASGDTYEEAVEEAQELVRRRDEQARPEDDLLGFRSRSSGPPVVRTIE